MKTNKIEYIDASSLIPESWGWFWGIFSSDAPFSWGDNDVTLIKASRFAEHFEDIMNCYKIIEVSEEELEEFVKKVKDLGDTLIALEL